MVLKTGINEPAPVIGVLKRAGSQAVALPPNLALGFRSSVGPLLEDFPSGGEPRIAPAVADSQYTIQFRQVVGVKSGLGGRGPNVGDQLSLGGTAQPSLRLPQRRRRPKSPSQMQIVE